MSQLFVNTEYEDSRTWKLGGHRGMDVPGGEDNQEDVQIGKQT
jgi:hypothetical protein